MSSPNSGNNDDPNARREAGASSGPDGIRERHQGHLVEAVGSGHRTSRSAGAMRAIERATAAGLVPGGDAGRRWLEAKVDAAALAWLADAYASKGCFFCSKGLEVCPECGGSGVSGVAGCENCAGIGAISCPMCAGSGLAPYSAIPSPLRFAVAECRVRRAADLVDAAAKANDAKASAIAHRVLQLNRSRAMLDNALEAVRQGTAEGTVEEAQKLTAAIRQLAATSERLLRNAAAEFAAALLEERKPHADLRAGQLRRIAEGAQMGSDLLRRRELDRLK